MGLIQIQRFPDVPEPGQKAAVQAVRPEPQDGRGQLSGAGMNGKGIRVRKREAVQREKTRWREAVQRGTAGWREAVQQLGTGGQETVQQGKTGWQEAVQRGTAGWQEAVQ
ncbi:hypothetical protein CBFG_05861 [Clostridiales bacterium 1_7_47FAA]|nr:hypothetical protein CBFG_05861 [Clostridiales bacterium 1_7_47FAA]